MLRVTPAPSIHSPATKFLWCAVIFSFPSSTPESGRPRRSNQPPPRQIAHERGKPEIPAFALFAGAHPVDEPPKLRRPDRHDVAGLVGEAHARRAAVGDRSEHRSEQKNEAVRIGVARTERLRDEVGWVAADLG